MSIATLLKVGLLALSFFASSATDAETAQDLDWWKTSTIYQIYPRSFKDSDGDGVGDLNGITGKLEHIKDIGADALWLSPIYSSPQRDFGYDISNFTDIHKEYGTLADFDKLVKKAKSLKLKVLLDFVPNHSSDEHEWFKKSIDRVKPYDDFYIWRDGKKDEKNKTIPPNNWLSNFGGSAWGWNEKRKQYYYHGFSVQQPDLNYRNAKLDQQMKDVLTFWMKRGVDGFRVDVINHVFEVENLKDEPKSGNDVPKDDYDYLDHIYTKDLKENYGLVQSWMKLLDDYTKEHKTDGKTMILEAYTSIKNSMQYYEVGANPFNFMFIATLNNNSRAVDFKKTINNWLKAVPKGKVSNWVVGNHDNHRVASRYGHDNNRADQISMLSAVLPGILVIYNGDEIGMVNRFFTYKETVDPAGCNAGPDRYQLKSRDPERTPYQWDATTSAGFSTNNKTWLPVNTNYKKLNLAAQKTAKISHYSVFKKLSALKKTQVLKVGSTEVLLATSRVLAVIRRIPNVGTVTLLINFDDRAITIDARTWLNIPIKMKIYVASVKSNLELDKEVDTTKLTIPAAASVILN